MQVALPLLPKTFVTPIFPHLQVFEIRATTTRLLGDMWVVEFAVEANQKVSYKTNYSLALTKEQVWQHFAALYHLQE